VAYQPTDFYGSLGLLFAVFLVMVFHQASGKGLVEGHWGRCALSEWSTLNWLSARYNFSPALTGWTAGYHRALHGSILGMDHRHGGAMGIVDGTMAQFTAGLGLYDDGRKSAYKERKVGRGVGSISLKSSTVLIHFRSSRNCTKSFHLQECVTSLRSDLLLLSRH